MELFPFRKPFPGSFPLLECGVGCILDDTDVQNTPDIILQEIHRSINVINSLFIIFRLINCILCYIMNLTSNVSVHLIEDYKISNACFLEDIDPIFKIFKNS